MTRAWIVAGLGFGDEGKGATVDWLVRATGDPARAVVVRYNGGPQAAHHVVTDEGRDFCFAQLGAGMLAGARTHLARTVLVDPLALVAEARAIAALGVDGALARLTIDPRCVVVTPLHAIVNRMQELARGSRRHGSCGRGVAQAQLDAERGLVPSLRLGDARDRPRLLFLLDQIWRAKLDLADQLVDEHPRDDALRALRDDLARRDRVPQLLDTYHALACAGAPRLVEDPAIAAGERVIFEGAQGVLLDRDHGLWPHVTPSRTTFAHALALVDEWGLGRSVRVGVLRAYATRHGAGPLPTEDASWAGAERFAERHNRTDEWQGAFRVGPFDAVLVRHALAAVGGVDALVVNHLDRAAPWLCDEYRDGEEVLRELPRLAGDDFAARAALTERLARVHPQRRETSDLVRAIAASLGQPVAAIAEGPRARDRTALDGAALRLA